MDKSKILKAILLIAVVVAFFFSIKSCTDARKQVDVLKEQKDLAIAAKDSLRVEYDKKTGEATYSKAALAASEKTLDDYLAKNNKPLSDLKKKDKAIFGASTTFETPIDTAVAVEARPDSTDDVRSAHIIDPYFVADVAASRDSIKLSVAPIDTMSLTMDKDYRVRVRFQNPKSKVTELTPFYVKPAPQKSKNWKYFLGIAAGAIGTGLLLK